jgi:hypothetical protein
METIAQLGTLLGIGLASGFRLYATVLALGLGIRLGWLDLDPRFEHLRVLASWQVLVPAGFAFLMEFVADKIAWVDSFWDSFHTLIRPIGAALLAATAIGTIDSPAALGLALLTGGVALTGHTAKAGARLMVNHSPEPFSNIGVSFAEEGMVLFAIWLAVEHPLMMLGALAVFLALFIWLVPKLFRLIRNSLRAVGSKFRGARPPTPDISA